MTKYPDKYIYIIVDVKSVSIHQNNIRFKFQINRVSHDTHHFHRLISFFFFNETSKFKFKTHIHLFIY